MEKKIKELKKRVDELNELDTEEKSNAVKIIEQWYAEDKGMELLEEQLNKISQRFTPILKEIGLI
jgi:hypothetical protein